MKILSSEYEETPKLTVMFRDLRILAVSLDLSKEQEPFFLLKLLESCPNLQKFTLSAAGTHSDSNLPLFIDPTDRLSSISCLTTSLVQFKFIGFKPQEYQKKIMVFLLTQAKKLAKVGVEFDNCELASVKKIMQSGRRSTIKRLCTKYKRNYMELDYT